MEFFDRKFAAKLEQISLVRSRLAHRSFSGEDYLSRRGHSPEFHDYREYAQGDELRGVDWNIYARLGKLYRREYEQENDLHLRIMLDCSKSMESKFYRMLQLTAAMAYCALCGGCRVAVQPLYDSVQPLQSMPAMDFSSQNEFSVLCRGLAGLVPQGGNSFEACLKSYQNRRTSGQGVRVILSDFFWDRGTDRFFRQLAGFFDEQHFIHLLDQNEVSPPVNGRMRLLDSETGGGINIEGSAVLGQYREELHSYCQSLRRRCLAVNCGYVQLNSGMELEESVLVGLRRCGLLL